MTTLKCFPRGEVYASPVRALHLSVVGAMGRIGSSRVAGDASK